MIKGILFDKDGTLFDFNATWGAFTETLLLSEVGGDLDRVQLLADRLGYDLANKVFFPGSIVIAETVDVVAGHILPLLPETDKASLIGRMNGLAAQVPQIEAAPLVPFVEGLKARGLRIGVCTNDAEAPARSHLGRAGVEEAFDFIAGYDSGHGAKPAPGPLLAFARAVDLDPAHCIMVGDSLHDLHAGRAAGMRPVGVLTGPAGAEELATVAEVVLDSIADLTDWVDRQNA